MNELLILVTVLGISAGYGPLTASKGRQIPPSESRPQSDNEVFPNTQVQSGTLPDGTNYQLTSTTFNPAGESSASSGFWWAGPNSPFGKKVPAAKPNHEKSPCDNGGFGHGCNGGEGSPSPQPAPQPHKPIDFSNNPFLSALFSGSTFLPPSSFHPRPTQPEGGLPNKPESPIGQEPNQLPFGHSNPSRPPSGYQPNQQQPQHPSQQRPDGSDPLESPEQQSNQPPFNQNPFFPHLPSSQQPSQSPFGQHPSTAHPQSTQPFNQPNEFEPQNQENNLDSISKRPSNNYPSPESPNQESQQSLPPGEELNPEQTTHPIDLPNNPFLSSALQNPIQYSEHPNSCNKDDHFCAPAWACNNGVIIDPIIENKRKVNNIILLSYFEFVECSLAWEFYLLQYFCLLRKISDAL